MTSAVISMSSRVRPPAARPRSIAGTVRSHMWRSLLNGMTRMPSATSAAISFILGPSAPTRILGMPWGFGPGSNAGVINVWVV
jgi:hypothetical protein